MEGTGGGGFGPPSPPPQLISDLFKVHADLN